MPAAAKSEPKCTEVLCSASVGGKVQTVKYDISQDYHYSISRKYDVPGDWTEEEVDEFQSVKCIELREKLEPIAQVEVDELMDQYKASRGQG